MSEELKLGELIHELPKSKRMAKDARDNGKYPFFVCSGTAKRSDYDDYTEEAIVLSTGGSAYAHYCNTKFSASGDTWVLATEKSKLDTRFAYYFLEHRKKSIQEEGFQGSGLKHLRKDFIREMDIVLPTLPEQKKIAEILSGIDRSIQAEVNMASKITKQYQGVLSQIFDDVSKQMPLGDYLPLGDLGLDISDGNYSAKYPSASEFVERGVPFIRASNMKEGTIDDKDMRFISATKHQEITKGHLKSGDILIANRGEIGKTSRVPERHIGSNINAQVVRINGGIRIDSSFLFHYLSSPFCQKLIDELTTGTALKQLPIGNLVKLLIPVPEMSMQIATGGALDSMQRVMNAITEKSRKRSQLKHALAIELLSGRKRVSV